MTTAQLMEETARLRDRIALDEEPLAFFYTDGEPKGYLSPTEGSGCIFSVVARARRGETVYFAREHYGCGGGGYYLGFCPARPEIAEFVSTGIPGRMAGERYKKSPDLVRRFLDRHPAPPAPAAYAVFRPMSALTDSDDPQVIICFAVADQLAGLAGLAGYARDEDAVICPFGSGCSTVVTSPLLEAQREQPRAVLGMFDPSARPFIEKDRISFAAPRALWEEMLGNTEESFLSTKTWDKVRRRLLRGAPG